ncbi:hypothetical protein D3C76_322870 [compost metagenome]
MRTFAQLRIRREFPTAVVADDDFADFYAIVDDGDFVARLQAATAEGRAAVIGATAIADITDDRADVVDGFFDTTGTGARLDRRDGVDDDDIGIGRQADVTRGVSRHGSEAVLAIFKG